MFQARWKGFQTHTEAAADTIWAYVRKHAHRLHQPDAWLNTADCSVDRHAAHEGEAGWLALRPGDVLLYSQVMRLPFITHDAVYVGKGYVVSLNRPFNSAINRANVTVEALDKRVLAGRTWRHSPHNAGQDRATRLAVAWRALSSTGIYAYHPVRFNCQHAAHLWITGDLGSHGLSVGVGRFMSIAILVVLVWLAVLALAK